MKKIPKIRKIEGNNSIKDVYKIYGYFLRRRIQSPKYFHSWCRCMSSTPGFLKGILFGSLTAGLILAILIALLMTSSSSSNVTTTTTTTSSMFSSNKFRI